MELLNYPKSDYLLDASLESLHSQSVAWINELAFWNDELMFFYHLLKHQKLTEIFPPLQVAEMEKEILRLHGDDLARLKAGVTSHEQLLAQVYKAPSSAGEQVYRETHRRLLHDMHMLDTSTRSFKTKLFSFLENKI